MTEMIIKQPFGSDDVRILDRKTTHAGFIRVERLQLRCQLFEGGWSHPFERELVHHRSGAGVLIYDPALDKVLMIEQFRVGCIEDGKTGPWALELVAGLQENDEPAEQLVLREAQEEAGITLTKLLRIHEYYPSPGSSSEKILLFCALADLENFQAGIHGQENENENIRSLVLDRPEADAALQAGQINNAMSIIALQWLSMNHQKLRSL